MIKTFLSAAALSLTLASASWALPVSQTPSLSSGLIQIRDYDNGHHGGGKYYGKRKYRGNYQGYGHSRGYRYGDRYWGHRYLENVDHPA